MQLLNSALFGLLAASTTFANVSKRQTTNYIKDGGFETVPKADVGKNGFTGGGWTFAGHATLYRNDGGEENTPYGQQFAHILGNSAASGGTISQSVSGLTVGANSLLTYKIRQWMPPYYGTCQFSITLGSQTLDSYEIVGESSGQINWETRSIANKLTVSSGEFVIKLTCTKDMGGGYDIQFDNLSLTD